MVLKLNINFSCYTVKNVHLLQLNLRLVTALNHLNIINLAVPVISTWKWSWISCNLQNQFVNKLVHWEHWIKITTLHLNISPRVTLQLFIITMLKLPHSNIRDYSHFWVQNISFKDRTIVQPKIRRQKWINKAVRWDCSRRSSIRQLTTGPALSL